MNTIIARPPLVFVLSLLLLWLCAQVGMVLARRRTNVSAEAREDFAVVQAATLTLLGLIIGFTFSMALNRYDQRKNYEEGEANAIGTEFVRADLLAAADAEKMRALLARFVDERVLFYTVRDPQQLQDIGLATDRLEADLWSSIRAPAAAQPTPIVALVVSGMNDVLNAEGYTHAAWRNRIPSGAWVLMVTIAAFCSGMIGFGKRTPRGEGKVLYILPLTVAISFTLIADIDSPRSGVIRVVPQNLIALASSLHAH